MALLKFKITFIGDQATGKTSLITRFKHGSFDGDYQATIGVDFLSKTVFVGGTSVRLQLWDSAGQERFHSLIPSYVRDSMAVVIVFDLSNPQSFNSVTLWLEDVKKSRGEDVLLFLVGNKSDLASKSAEAASLAHKLGMTYFEVSAKTGENVENLFKTLAEKLLETAAPPPSQRVPTVKLDHSAAAPSSSCSC